MKFDFCIGNPPYQGDNHQQVYPVFYLSGQQIADCVDMIFPTGWQAPKNANNLSLLNNADVKEDKQIVFIDNKQNVFSGVSGAEWTNIIFWKKGYDNKLSGMQKILTNGANAKTEHLNFELSQISKPQEILDLFELVKKAGKFKSIADITSSRKPYGLTTDFDIDPTKYGFEPIADKRKDDTDIKIYCKGGKEKYAHKGYALPKTSDAINKYKVFVPYAWGNMSEKTGLGGAFSDIVIASPNEICTESYLESGKFDDLETATKHAKYLMTKFLRALLYINKFSQHSTTSWGAIPIQDYKEKWWNLSIEEIDKELMKKYKVPQNIQKFVFDNFQTKTERNITNYTEMA